MTEPRPRAKPKPLAERIDPLQAKLDSLDKLERELDNEREMPFERVAELRRSIIAQRHAIHKRIDKRDGIAEESEPQEWQTIVLPWHTIARHQIATWWASVKPWHFWCTLALIIFLGLRK
jgi:hypothetical protein